MIFIFKYSFIDDIFAYALPEKINLITHELNSYYSSNINFTYKFELHNKLAFLDFFLTKINSSKTEISLYRKATNTNIYINWYSHTLLNRKAGALRNLLKRVKLISSTQLLLRNDNDNGKCPSERWKDDHVEETKVCNASSV